ncbi:MAG: CerR family C-terminal domain-containing protein [Planctomycetes bacterium]|nr:CerR family C-terminal domain-containing protein [Planctomycetota bacterium]
MVKQRKDGVQTRERLIEAACAVFVEKGYRDATIAEICGKAGANIAAVNYHFGGKDALYVEAWRWGVRQSLEVHPPDGGVPPTAPAEERLQGRIRAMMERISDPNSLGLDMVMKEMANPTGLLTEAMHEELESVRAEFMGIVRELLGAGATEQQVRFCHMSIMAQCFGPLLRERRRKSAGSTLPPRPSDWPEMDVAALADHVVRFSLGGIREMRRSEGGRAKKRRRPSSRS